MTRIKIFKYIDQLDCFIVDPEYKRLADEIGLSEWNEVVWIGRFFLLDNDLGEHWFDNWEGRSMLAEKAKSLGLDEHDLLVINPRTFQNGVDGPCHTDQERLIFWTEVLKSLELSIDIIFAEAIKFNEERATTDEEFIPDLFERIKMIKATYL